MSDEIVFNLGEVNAAPKVPRSRSAHAADYAAMQHLRDSRWDRIGSASARIGSTLGPVAERIDRSLELTAGLSLLLPGSGRLARGNVRVGLFFLSAFGFLAALSWAVLGTLGQLTETLELLSLPREGGVWVLVGAYVAAATLYVINVLCAVPRETGAKQPPHPAVVGVASLILPGLGQVHNRDLGRAAVLLGGLWIAGAAWLLAWPETQSLLTSLGLHLPTAVVPFCSPTVRWSLLVVIWVLGVYDAVFTAKSRRGSM